MSFDEKLAGFSGNVDDIDLKPSQGKTSGSLLHSAYTSVLKKKIAVTIDGLRGSLALFSEASLCGLR